MIKKFGIGKVTRLKYISLFGCKDVATHFIGDIDKPNRSTNIYVNEKMLRGLREEVDNILGGQDNNLYKKFVKHVYDNGITKNGLTDFCNENNIELPDNKDEFKIKDFFNTIFTGMED